MIWYADTSAQKPTHDTVKYTLQRNNAHRLIADNELAGVEPTATGLTTIAS